MSFLDTSILRYFLRPYFIAGRLTLRVATRTGAAALRLADRYLGLQFLQDLSEFFLAFEGMYDGFKERASRVHALLRGAGSGFVLVTSPGPQALEEALFFYRRLREKRMPFVGFVVNRLHPEPSEGQLARGADDVAVGPELGARLVEIYRDQQRLARAERRALTRLEVDADEAIVTVPEFEADIHDLRGLRDFGETVL
jgi:anion-transporting  ArsA/GET3 family ATPase